MKKNDKRGGGADLSSIHFTIEGDMTHFDIRGRLVDAASAEYSGATCTRCDAHYVYSGKNPGYCPKCLALPHTRPIQGECLKEVTDAKPKRKPAS